jgi:hypothetical protein
MHGATIKIHSKRVSEHRVKQNIDLEEKKW